MRGFFNIALRIDVSQRAFEIESIPDSLLKTTLGGKGLATHLLLKYNSPGVDPLGPENHLIFAIGPVTKTALWGSCRHGVYTKSPLTGCYAESYSGGTAAESIAATGADAIMVYGVSEEPVWLEIAENSVLFHPAGDLWGLDTYRTGDKVKAWLKENRPEAKRAGVVTIGPAGENLVAFAVIENDYRRSDGRTGVGAVLGSKKIKAVAFWGNRSKEIADPDRMKQFAADLAKASKDNPGVKACKTFGTPMPVDILNKAGGSPTRYRQKGWFERCQEVSAAALHARCEVKPHACLKCLMACGRLSTVKDGRHKGLTLEGPECETIDAFGGLCEVDRIEGMAKVFAEWEDRLTLFDTLIICRFYRDLYQWEQLSSIIAAATGLELGTGEMRAVAARVASNTRRFNLREGLTATDDRLPIRFTTEALPESNSLISEDEMQVLLKEYYAERGWDDSGNPG
jgi:aldehyde:ferredoxin oxidoreductase